jgi:hypothetical protein
MYDALRNEYEQLKQSGGKEQAMIKQSNLYSFNVPMQSGFEETHKTQPTSGQNSALAYWLHILILISDSTISLLRIYRSSLNRGR